MFLSTPFPSTQSFTLIVYNSRPKQDTLICSVGPSPISLLQTSWERLLEQSLTKRVGFQEADVVKMMLQIDKGFQTRGHKIGKSCFLGAFAHAVSSTFTAFPKLVPLVNIITDFQDTAQIALQDTLLCILMAWCNAVLGYSSHFCNYGFPLLGCKPPEAKNCYSCFHFQCLAVSDWVNVWVNEWRINYDLAHAARMQGI